MKFELLTEGQCLGTHSCVYLILYCYIAGKLLYVRAILVRENDAGCTYLSIFIRYLMAPFVPVEFRGLDHV